MLEKSKITTPTEIQEKTIPLVLAGRDIIGGSATGSGKTLVFASSIIENLEKNGKVQALILTPTRELAEQVADVIAKLSRQKKLNVLPVYGGVDIRSQIRFLKNTDVVVGTPGRILDHLNRKTLNLEEVKFLVLDEVDRMFDMGFQADVERILNQCPKKRQTMLFSATISSEIDYLAKKYTKNPAEISIESHVDASKLKQVYYDVPDGLKFSLFVHLLKKEKAKLIMVFCGTRRNVDFVADNLNNLGIMAKAIHGGMHQNKRNSALNEFNSKNSVNVLVCTDVAARGLDIEEVSHVYNYDLPKSSGEYIHRVGRTARAGKEGIAINILCSRDYENFRSIRRDEKLKIEAIKLPHFERVGIIVDNKNRRGSYNASRGKSYSREQNNKPRDSRSYRGRSGENKTNYSSDNRRERQAFGRERNQSQRGSFGRRSNKPKRSRSSKGQGSGGRDYSRGSSSNSRNNNRVGRSNYGRGRR